jgi:hypothetical protein
MILFTLLKGARFTTSTNVDNPEYYFQTNKVKFIPGKVITGLTNLVIADVPTPIALPFIFLLVKRPIYPVSYYLVTTTQILEVFIAKWRILFCFKR